MTYFSFMTFQKTENGFEAERRDWLRDRSELVKRYQELEEYKKNVKLFLIIIFYSSMLSYRRFRCLVIRKPGWQDPTVLELSYMP